jgi:hypothetical protein
VDLRALLLIASAVNVVWLVERRLYLNLNGITQGLRMLALAYVSAVPAVWRRLRERP